MTSYLNIICLTSNSNYTSDHTLFSDMTGHMTRLFTKNMTLKEVVKMNWMILVAILTIRTSLKKRMK